MRTLKQRLNKWLASPGGRRALAGLTVATTTLGAVVVRAAEAHGGHHAELSINWWRWEQHAPPVGWFILDFILFVGLIVYFARKPIRAAFLARHERIKKAIGEAEEAHAKAQARHDEYRQKLADVEAESKTHVEHGKADGALERDQIIAAARDYAERLRLDAHAVIDQEVDKARDRLQHEAVTLLLSKTEEILRHTLTDSDRARLLDEAISGLEQAPVALRPRSGGAATGEAS